MSRACLILLAASALLLLQPPAAAAQQGDVAFPVCALLSPGFCADAAYFLADSTYVVEVYFTVCNDGLLFARGERGYRASADLSAVLLDGDGGQIAGDTYRVRLSAPDYEATKAVDSCASHVMAFRARAGDCKLVLGLYDRDSRARSLVEARLKIAPMLDFPSISDLVLLGGAGGGGPGRSGAPANVRRVYTGTEDSIPVYYEVYHGQAAESLVVVHSLAASGGEKVAEAVASSVGRGRVVHHAGLRADSLPNGRYTLSVEVRDRAGNKVASRSKDLEIRHGTFNLGSDVDLAVAMLTYIASGSEIDRFEKASGDERKGLWEEFWRERDPTPGTPRNEFLEEHERRFRYANERFGVALTDGWRTDRGRIFILYGEPDQVDSYPFEVGRKPTEVWYYFSGGRRFVFVDETGFGDYVLVGSGG